MIFLFQFKEWQSIIFQALPKFIPEYILITAIILLILLARWFRPYFFLLVSLAALISECFFVHSTDFVCFKGAIVFNAFYAKVTILGALISFLTLWFSQLTLNPLKPEFYVYILTAQLGLQILALSQNWLLSFIAFEMVSVVGYLLVLSLKKHSATSISGVKFFLYGAFASSLMLYGISLYYGIHQNVFIHNPLKNIGIEKVSLGFILIGVLFKLSIFPLHFWKPEVYYGTSAAAAVWISNLSKLAGATFFLVLFKHPIPEELQTILWAIAVLSMLIGNLGILQHNDFYRLMGYSSIAHSGFLLMTMAVGTEFARSTALFYLLFSVPTTFLTFYAGHKFIQVTGSQDFSRWNGIGRLLPASAFLMVVGIASLVGLPPTVGFIGKFYLALPLWEAYSKTHNALILIVLTAFVLNTLLALAAYSRIIVLILLRSPSEKVELSTKVQWLFALPLVVSVLFFGVYKFDSILQILR